MTRPSILVSLLVLGCSADFGDPPGSPPGQGASAPAEDTVPGSAPPTASATEEVPPGDGMDAVPPANETAPEIVDEDPLPPTGDTEPAGEAADPTGGPVQPVDATACAPVLSDGESRCQVSQTEIVCDGNDATVDGRLVVWQVPLGEAPTDGWPTVVIYQGSLFGPDVTWTGTPDMPFGGFNQVRLQAMLLDNGFAVVAPAADGVAWATNFPAYELSTDYTFVTDLLDAMKAGELGDLDPERFYATGISSGGYMTSRMAVTYPGNFRALAIESGSYATCSNVLCTIPPELPADHPPTLFLHGQNDVAVPIATAQAYDERLVADGVETDFVVDPSVGHQWLDVAPEEVTCWFSTH